MNIADIAAIVNGAGGGGGAGYKKETQYTTIYEGEVFFELASVVQAIIDPSDLTGNFTDTIRVTLDGDSYTAERYPVGSTAVGYGAEELDGYDFSEYPFGIFVEYSGGTPSFIKVAIDRQYGDHALKIEGISEELIISDGFKEAVNAVAGYDFVIKEDGDTSSGDYSLGSGDWQKVVNKVRAGELVRGIMYTHSFNRVESAYNYLYAIMYDDVAKSLKLRFSTFSNFYDLYWYPDGTVAP